MRIILALLSGVLFGAGLAISGMADPMRVRAFLDLVGAWDPTLAFVIGGAMIPMSLAWMVQKRIDRPFADRAFTLPNTDGIDGKLALGAILFGIAGSLNLLPVTYEMQPTHQQKLLQLKARHIFDSVTM